MADTSENAEFFVAPFAVDGESMGVGEWRLADLSHQWLELSRQMLDRGGDSFRTTLPAPLDQIAVRFTSAAGAALASFHVGGTLAVSTASLRGEDADAEQELLGLFVESLRRTAIVQSANAGNEMFGAVFRLTQRPLLVVVPWGTPKVAEELEEAVQDLATHLAGAFLCR